MPGLSPSSFLNSKQYSGSAGTTYNQPQMKRFFSNILARIFPAIAAMAALSGCDSLIYDYEGEDCDPVHIIRLKYEMNMKFADAFPAEVPSVDLYVFDKAGHLVTTVSRHVTPEEANDFKIELRGLPLDHYDILAWCGVKESQHFLVNHAGVADPAFEHHTCRINSLDEGEGEDRGHIRQDVGRLFHGRLLDVDMTPDEGTYEHTVYLTKDTNVIRVVLQHLSGAPMEKDDYEFKIEDANALYAHDNSLLPHKDITYHPWVVKSAEASFHPEDEPQADESRAQTSVSAVVAELTVGRLMADRIEDALLVVNSSDGTNIITIPLIKYLLLVKGHYYGADGHTPMDDQQYLDREDDYPMTFFLDERDHWLKTVIYINEWRVVLNESTLH